MRKVLTIVFVLGFSLSLFGQSRVPTDKSYYEKYIKPQKIAYLYLEGGLSIPRGDFGQAQSLDSPLLDPFIGEDGMGGQTGYAFSVGFRFPFGGFYDACNKVYPTFNFGAEIISNNIDFSDINSSITTQKPFMMGGAELGAGLSWNIANRFVIEGNYDILLPLAENYISLSYEGNSETGFLIEESMSISEEVEDPYRIGHTIGISVRRNAFRLFMEWFSYNYSKRYQITRGEDLEFGPSETFNADFDIKTMKVGISIMFLE